MRLGIVGYGTVGKHLERLFLPTGFELVIYDKYRPSDKASGTPLTINTCDLVFLAVPTPSHVDGECDLTEIRDAVSWIDRPLCIKSTVPPGTTDSLRGETGKQIAFCPEYVGETPFHRYANDVDYELVAVGSDKWTANVFLNAYRLALGPNPVYFATDAITAELSKYMENCFFATKVTFVAQFYNLAQRFGVDFNVLREIWTADSRVGRSHSTVIGKPGYGGRCLPKDMAALIASARRQGYDCEFLEHVQSYNDKLHGGGAGNEQILPHNIAKPD